jgi:hypothetical protein
VIGINPEPHTMRELHWMSVGKGESDWWHTAVLVATIRNLMLGKDQKPTQPIDVHPHRDRINRRRPKTAADIPESEWSEERRQYEREMKAVETAELRRAVEQMSTRGR